VIGEESIYHSATCRLTTCRTEIADGSREKIKVRQHRVLRGSWAFTGQRCCLQGCASRRRCRWGCRSGAQGFFHRATRPLQVGGDTLDIHIESGVVVRLVAERGDVAADAGSLWSDHRRRSSLRNRPAKHLDIELLCFLGITAANLEMNDGTSHRCASSARAGLERGSLPQEG